MKPGSLVCAALLLREWAERTVRVATFDTRLGELAADLGMEW